MFIWPNVPRNWQACPKFRWPGTHQFHCPSNGQSIEMEYFRPFAEDDWLASRTPFCVYVCSCKCYLCFLFPAHSCHKLWQLFKSLPFQIASISLRLSNACCTPLRHTREKKKHSAWLNLTSFDILKANYQPINTCSANTARERLMEVKLKSLCSPSSLPYLPGSSNELWQGHLHIQAAFARQRFNRSLYFPLLPLSVHQIIFC